MAQITNAAREKRFRAVVDEVTQSFTRITYAQVAELLYNDDRDTWYAKVAELDYNDSHADRFAALFHDDRGAWDAKVNYVRQEFTRSTEKRRPFGDAAMAKWAGLIARLIKGTADYEPFTEEMVKLDVAQRRLRTDPFTDGTHEIVFATPEKSGDAELRQREEKAKVRLDAIRGKRLRAELTKPNPVRIVSQDGGEERCDSGEGWRAGYADADSAPR